MLTPPYPGCLLPRTAQARVPCPGLRLTMAEGTFIQQDLTDSHGLAP